MKDDLPLSESIPDPNSGVGLCIICPLVKKRSRRQVMPDLQVAIFVCVVYYIVYFLLLK